MFLFIIVSLDATCKGQAFFLELSSLNEQGCVPLCREILALNLERKRLTCLDGRLARTCEPVQHLLQAKRNRELDQASQLSILFAGYISDDRSNLHLRRLEATARCR